MRVGAKLLLRLAPHKIQPARVLAPGVDNAARDRNQQRALLPSAEGAEFGAQFGINLLHALAPAQVRTACRGRARAGASAASEFSTLLLVRQNCQRDSSQPCPVRRAPQPALACASREKFYFKHTLSLATSCGAVCRRPGTRPAHAACSALLRPSPRAGGGISPASISFVAGSHRCCFRCAACRVPRTCRQIEPFILAGSRVLQSEC